MVPVGEFVNVPVVSVRVAAAAALLVSSIAAELVNNHLDMSSMPAAIARALDAAEERGKRPPEGHILTPDGKVRKCPPLPVTKDGAVAFPGTVVYFHGFKSGFIVQTDLTVCVSVQDDDGGWRDATVQECYSTHEAAEAAKEARDEE